MRKNRTQDEKKEEMSEEEMIKKERKERKKMKERLQIEFPDVPSRFEKKENKIIEKQEMTTFQKVSKLAGEMVIPGFLVWAIIQTLIDYYNGERGLIVSTGIVIICTWVLCGIWDIVTTITYKEFFKKKTK